MSWDVLSEFCHAYFSASPAVFTASFVWSPLFFFFFFVEIEVISVEG